MKCNQLSYGIYSYAKQGTASELTKGVSVLS